MAILFGSLASGRGTAESDLDLAMDAGRPLDLSLKMQLIAQLADRIGRPVDLIDLRSAGEPLLGQILRYGKNRRNLRKIRAYSKGSRQGGRRPPAREKRR